jgi:hypothetical protein
MLVRSGGCRSCGLGWAARLTAGRLRLGDGRGATPRAFTLSLDRCRGESLGRRLPYALAAAVRVAGAEGRRPAAGCVVAQRPLQARGTTADGVAAGVASVTQRLRRHLFEKGAILW